MVDELPSPEQEKTQQFKSAGRQKKKTTETKRTSQKSMATRKVNYENIEKEVMAGSCCSRRCIQSILTVPDIYKTREWFFKKSRESQGQFLLNFFQIARRLKGQKTVYIHTVENKDVCQKAWIFSYGIAYGRYLNLSNLLLNEIVVRCSGKTGVVAGNKAL